MKIDFGDALKCLKKNDGKLYGVRLKDWPSNVILKAQYPNDTNKMASPYLYIDSPDGVFTWAAPMYDLFSEQWEIIVLNSGEVVSELFCN